MVEVDSAEIRPDDGEVHVLKVTDRLELDDNAVLHEQIEDMLSDVVAEISNGDAELALETDLAFVKLDP